jgi:hypothetical protein
MAPRKQMAPRAVLLFTMIAGFGCGGAGPLKTPFAGLQAGGCLDNTDCEIGSCPNACNHGQTFCSYPAVFARADIVRKCPCVDTPSAQSCQPPSVESCGPQPKCASPADLDQLRARCVGGMCAARFTDGGTPH